MERQEGPRKRPADLGRTPRRQTRVCAWCGRVMQRGEPGAGETHGICASCLVGMGTPFESAPEFSALEYDRLPFGVIEVDPDGVVVAYNEWEEELSGLHRAEVLGRDFFHEIAPCMRVPEAFAVFRELAADPAGGRHSFAFVFEFEGGRRRFVRIRMTRDAGERTVRILVEESE